MKECFKKLFMCMCVVLFVNNAYAGLSGQKKTELLGNIERCETLSSCIDIENNIKDLIQSDDLTDTDFQWLTQIAYPALEEKKEELVEAHNEWKHRIKNETRVGMTKQQIFTLWGKPTHIKKSVFKNETSEVWTLKTGPGIDDVGHVRFKDDKVISWED